MISEPDPTEDEIIAALDLFERGKDTLEIAQTLKRSEAWVYRLLSETRECFFEEPF